MLSRGPKHKELNLSSDKKPDSVAMLQFRLVIRVGAELTRDFMPPELN